MDFLPNIIYIPPESEVQKVNRGELFSQVLNATDKDKLIMLKMIFDDLNMGNIINASKYFGTTPNGVRKTKDTIKLDKKEFTRLIKNERKT
jgi:hypothetical protein